MVTPAGYPDTVYLGGSYQYGEYGGVSNSRGVLYSTDAGQSFTDESWDATSASTPNGIHPDQHALVVNPSNPTQFFEGSDGGLMRSSGSFADTSSQCAARGLSGADLALCQQLLSRIPTQLSSLNEGLSTLQFQSLSVAPDNPKHLQGGTQDNGTFETTGSTTNWPQIIYGDGGQSGFSATNSSLRFNTFTGQATMRTSATATRQSGSSQRGQSSPAQKDRTSIHQSRLIQIQPTLARSTRVPRASGERRTGVAIRPTSRPTALSSPLPPRTQPVATSCASGLRERLI